MKLLRRLAQSGVVLRDEKPANLILGDVAVARAGIGTEVGRSWATSRKLGSLVLVSTVGRHDCWGGGGGGGVYESVGGRIVPIEVV